MIIERYWSMPSRWTFSIKPIKNQIESIVEYLTNMDGIIVDPFVGKSIFRKHCNLTNDLNPTIDADSNIRADEFLKNIDSDSTKLLFLDPPYSPRQIKECYDGIGLKVGQDSRSDFYSNLKKEASRIVKKGGYCLSFGWNSGGVGKKYGFEIIKILLIAHGASGNDTIMTIEKRL